MKIVSIINQKGGVGKSTIAVNLCATLRKSNQRILMIDMDPQGHLSLGLGINKDCLDKTTFDILDIRQNPSANIKDIWIKLEEGFHLIPANVKLSTMELILANRHGRENQLTKALTPEIKNEFDYIIIDCPPNLGLLTINALIASNYALIPFDPSLYSVDGINYLNTTLNMLQNKINHFVNFRYLLNNFDSRIQKNQKFLRDVKKSFGNKLFKSVIRKSSYFVDATNNKTHIFKNKKSNTAKKDLLSFTKEFFTWTDPAIQMLKKGSMKIITEKANFKNVTFTIKHFHAKEIKVAGTFNDWDPTIHKMERVAPDGTWAITLPVEKGRHQYKFVVDGKWIEDKQNNLKVETMSGVYNSVVHVG